MDALGFGLENFDTIGRWRETEKVGRKSVTIDPASSLPDGSTFSTVQELKSVLMKHEGQLAEELVESIMGYALGRTIEFSDSEAVAEGTIDHSSAMTSVITGPPSSGQLIRLH